MNIGLYNERTWDVVIIGAGLAGLTASIYLATAGVKVLLLEKASKCGGRAQTTTIEGAQLNLGPHALFRDAVKILKEIGAEPQGKTPKLNAVLAFHGEENEDKLVHQFELLLGKHFRWTEKMELIRLFTRIRKTDTSGLQSVSLNQFLQTVLENDSVRDFVRALARVVTYCNAPDLISAGAVIKQFQMGNVMYVHGGWGAVVQDLKEKALSAGVIMQNETSVIQIQGTVPEMAVVLKDGTLVRTKYVVSTTSPGTLLQLLDQPLAEEEAVIYRNLIPVHAACLDLLLDGVPNSGISFSLSVNRPLYFSNHSASAKLTANPNHAVVHAMKYIDPSEKTDSAKIEAELEHLMDLVQPGWQQKIISRRFLPQMTVSHAVVTAEMGGISGRPPVGMLGKPGLYLAGDWVGNEGLLASASLASAKRAARCIIDQIDIRGAKARYAN